MSPIIVRTKNGVIVAALGSTYGDRIASSSIIAPGTVMMREDWPGPVKQMTIDQYPFLARNSSQ